MLNEGILINDTKTLMKSTMINRLRARGESTPHDLERDVFHVLTGGRREEVDWDFEDNQKGVFLWFKEFDALIDELVDDGFFRVERKGDQIWLLPRDTDPHLGYSHLVYPGAND